MNTITFLFPKSSLLLLLIIQLCFACDHGKKTPSQSGEIFLSDNDLYYLKVSRSESGSGSGTSRGDSMFTFKNYALRDILISLSEDKSLRFKNDSKKHKALDLVFRGRKVDYDKGRALVKDSLSKIFNFKMDDTVVYDSIWVAKVVDAAKLHQHTTQNSDGTMGVVERIVNHELTLNNASLKKLTDNLAEHLDVIISDGSTDKEKYNFNLNISTMRKVQEQLFEHYGILLKKEYRPIKIFQIEFL